MIMTNTKAIHHELERKVFEAVQKNIIEPNEVIAYIMNNGWEYDKPSKVTIISLLNKNHVNYVWGRWEKAE
jgi:hypothetical protein